MDAYMLRQWRPSLWSSGGWYHQAIVWRRFPWTWMQRGPFHPPRRSPSNQNHQFRVSNSQKTQSHFTVKTDEARQEHAPRWHHTRSVRRSRWTRRRSHRHPHHRQQGRGRTKTTWSGLRRRRLVWQWRPETGISKLRWKEKQMHAL